MGYCLCNSSPDDMNNVSIDLSGDVLTNVKSFSLVEDCNRLNDLVSLLEKIYHTHGNFIPWPEGANVGTGQGPKNDNYYEKLSKIKKYFDEKSYSVEALSNVKDNILKARNGQENLKKGKKNLQYWIYNEWISKNLKWEDFIKANLLFDYTDDQYELRPVIPFKNIERPIQDNAKTENLRTALLQTIKLIIQRGYRIDKGFTGKWNEARAKEVCEDFEEVGLPPDPDKVHGLPYTIIGEWEEVE